MKILDILESERVFTIDVRTRYIKITEACDRFFSYALDKDELGQLIDELRDIHRQL